MRRLTLCALLLVSPALAQDAAPAAPAPSAQARTQLPEVEPSVVGSKP